MMTVIRAAFAVGGLAALVDSPDPAALTISRETTFILQPLRADSSGRLAETAEGHTAAVSEAACALRAKTLMSTTAEAAP